MSRARLNQIKRNMTPEKIHQTHINLGSDLKEIISLLVSIMNNEDYSCLFTIKETETLSKAFQYIDSFKSLADDKLFDTEIIDQQVNNKRDLEVYYCNDKEGVL